MMTKKPVPFPRGAGEKSMTRTGTMTMRGGGAAGLYHIYIFPSSAHEVPPPERPSWKCLGWRWCSAPTWRCGKHFGGRASGPWGSASWWQNVRRTRRGARLKWSCRPLRTNQIAISLPRKNYLNSANDAPSTIYIYPDSIIDCLSR